MAQAALAVSALADWESVETGKLRARKQTQKIRSAEILNFGVALARKNAAEKGGQQQAIDAFSRAIALDPADAKGWFNRGRSYHQEQSDLDRAIADYSRAIDLNPGFAAAYNNRGAAYARIGKFDRAIADYSKTIDL